MFGWTLRMGALAAVGGLALVGCGQPRQDASEPSGTFPVSVDQASFPARQHIARPTVLRIRVHNAGRKAIPDLAVTVKGFDYASPQPGLADPHRPLWVVDSGPRGGDTAYVDTWALGSVPPGQSRTFEWHLTPVVAGTHHVTYRVAAGLTGKAKARTPQGGIPSGAFDVDVSGQPPNARVDPNTGAVVNSG